MPWESPTLIALGSLSTFITMPIAASTRSLCAAEMTLRHILARSNMPVSIADGTPTEKISRTKCFSRPIASRRRMLRGASAVAFLTAIRRYRQAITLESVVAIAAPTTSCPLGRRTNMNSGSSAMLRTPPMLRPKLAWPEYPAFRRRCASVSDKILGKLPSTMTIRAYWRANPIVASDAPRRRSTGSRNTPTSTE